MKIVEANFQTLSKEQIREVAAEIEKAIPDDERVIALDRVLANVDKSQIVPKNIEGIKADPPTIFFSKTPAVIVNLDGEPIWSPIKENDSEVRREHELGSLPARSDEHVLSPQQRHLAQGGRREGPVVAGRNAAGELQQAAGGRQLEGREGEPAREGDRGVGGAEGVRQPAAGRVDSSHRRADLSAGPGHGPAVGQQHRERSLPHGDKRRGLLPRRRPLVLGAGLHRPVDVRDAVAAGGLQEDSARARALARAGVGARHRPGHRGGAARADPADRAREQEGARRRPTSRSRATRSSRRSNRRPCSAR